MNYKINSNVVEVIWFKRDLRIYDNPLLYFASGNVLPIFIFDTNILNKHKRDDPSLTFLYNSVIKFKKEIRKLGLDLLILRGNPTDIFDYLNKIFRIVKIHTSREYDSYSRKTNNIIEKKFYLNLISDKFIFEPEDIITKSGSIYRVYTPFKNHIFTSLDEKLKRTFKPNKTLNLEKYDYQRLISLENGKKESLPLTIENIGLTHSSVKYSWADTSPVKLLQRLETIIDNYEEYRNCPAVDRTSHLSCALRLGRISIREVLRKIINKKNSTSFLKELLWREFFSYLFYHFPQTEKENLRDIKIQWENNTFKFERWKNGETGIPFVDAAMRQLKEEGFIHNRLRMIVASFLTKNLHIDWRIGEEYFSNMLLDYEPSSNIGNWQWVSGVGADPKSLYRIFNPFVQAQRFDPYAKYIKKYLPELRNLNHSLINNKEYINKNKLKNYPTPIVDVDSTAKEFKMRIIKQKWSKSLVD